MARSPYYQDAINAANAAGVPPAVFLALVHQESGWNPTAASNTGDYGLAQLNTQYYPNAWSMTPQQNLAAGAKHLAKNYQTQGNWRDALRAYNAGDKGAKDNPTRSAGYADAVLAKAAQLGWTPADPSKPSSVIDNALSNGTLGDLLGTPAPVDQSGGGIDLNPLDNGLDKAGAWLQANLWALGVGLLGTVIILGAAWALLSPTSSNVKALAHGKA